MILYSKQQLALIRICASCEKVYIISFKKNSSYDCPICGFGSYGSMWAIGWSKTLWKLLIGNHRYGKNYNKKTT